MKKVLILSLFALFFMQACKKDQSLIDNEKPEERAGKELQKYNDELIQSPNGWVAHLYTTEVKGDYGFYMNFKKDNVLNIRADFDENSLNVEQISTYRLKKVMATTLIFDTDNYLHELINPTSTRGGNPGTGFGSDTEFEFREQVGDTLKFVGKRRQARLILIKATAADKDFYTNDGGKALRDYLKANPYLYILDKNDGTKKIQVSVNSDIVNRNISFFALDNDIVTSAAQYFSFSSIGISNAPFTYKERIFIGFEWDKVNKKLFVLTSKGEKIEVLVSASTLIPLQFLIGVTYKSILVPNQKTYPGWGSDFIAQRAGADKLPYRLRLETMEFEFDSDTKKVLLTVGIPQFTTQYWATFRYDYTKTSAGIFKFTKDQSYSNGNANLIVDAMAPLLAQRFETDTFTLSYFVDPTTNAVLGQFKSVEHPNFTFTGTL
ncbi:DUF4302 domain-containing protein [Pedobacter nototheniae]|uniref:DUF4302 domain-containing protein n=1 Tax=Pedobacter nototheniae TaxID=2488994 RepID=UPI00103DB3FF|nr:DUF4302 domain-containing protein [Pedobacter nototheniae]